MTERKLRFDEEGFLVLERVISAEQIQQLRQSALDIAAAFDVSAHHSVFSTKDRDQGRDAYFMASAEAVHCFLEEEALDDAGQLQVDQRHAINKIGHALHDLVPAFRHFCQLPIFTCILMELGYWAPLLWQTMYIFKNPRIGGEVRWHQDASYLQTKPSTVIGIWVALDDASRENGCLWMSPGAHRSPLREVYEVPPETQNGTLSVIDDTPWPDAASALPIEVPAGSVVFFHDHMPHKSEANRSARPRHAFTLHVSEQSSQWAETNWLQRPTLGAHRLQMP